MKFNKIFILFLISVSFIHANPRRHHHSHPSRSNHYYNSMYASRYRSYYSPYRVNRYYTPVVVSTQTTTTYPSNLVTVTVETIATDIVDLNKLLARSIITEKDYERAKKTLLNRVGMSVNPDAGGASTTDLISQIETLYQMQEGQLITEKEFLKQKKKLLALI